MKTRWDDRALMQLKDIARYIKNNFGVIAKNKFLQEVRHVRQLLSANPYMGALDPLFSDRAKEYRSVIVDGMDKLVYYIEGDVVTIIAFWDCRQDPMAQAARVK